MKLLFEFVRMLSAAERRQLLLVVIGITAAALIDVAGVASVVPFLTLVASSGSGATMRGLAEFRAWLAVTDEGVFIVLIGLLSLAVITISNALNAWVAWAQLQFTYMVGFSLSRRLLGSYLAQDHLTLLTRNSVEMGKDILSEVDRAVSGLFTPVLMIAARSMTAICIVAFLMFIEPTLALLLAVVFGGPYVLVYIGIKRRLSRIGESAVEGNRVRFKIVAEAFSTLRELRLYGRLQTFIRRFDDPARNYAKATAASLMIGQMPRYVLEPLAFASVVMIVVHASRSGNNLNTVFPMIGLFAFAGYRLMPAFQSLFVSAAALRFYMPVLKAILNGLKASPHALPADQEPGAPRERFGELTLQNVNFAYGAGSVALKDINLSIAANSTVGLIGRTGSGKTTLLSLIIGLFVPTTGNIRLNDKPLIGSRLTAWQRRIGYVPQDIMLIDDTVAANIALGVPSDKIDMQAVERAARVAVVHDFIVSSLPEKYRTLVGERGARLSGGQRQRIGIARALYHDPDILVFDEATSGLDSETEEAFLAAIERLSGSRTVIVIAHRASTLRQANIVHMIENGRIVGSGPIEKFTSLFRAQIATGTGATADI